jgi:uncharacterized phosphosugar-binding protein
MSTLRYLDAIRGIVAHIESTQAEAIDRAAALVTESITHGGAVFCAEIGHANQQDFLNRAGGLAVVKPFSFNFNTNDPVAECRQNRPRPEPFERDLASIRFAVQASNMRAGDVLLLGSVSGKNRYPVELALACREMGVKVIGFTSFVYTANVTSLHPSGQKLIDVVDVVVDNGAPYGDGAVEIPGYDFPLCPVSGASMVILGWCIWERVMTRMAEAGTPATVFMSINREGGPAYYEQAVKQFNERGY